MVAFLSLLFLILSGKTQLMPNISMVIANESSSQYSTIPSYSIGKFLLDSKIGSEKIIFLSSTQPTNSSKLTPPHDTLLHITFFDFQNINMKKSFFVDSPFKDNPIHFINAKILDPDSLSIFINYCNY